MTTRNIITFGLSLTIFGCGQSVNKADNNSIKDTASIADTSVEATPSRPDTSNQYIYEFMKVVIVDQKLDLSYGMTTEPEQNCDLSQDDRIFLKTLLIEKTKPNKDTGDWRNITITIGQLPKCLTKGDIDEMLLQKEKLSNFTWDNSRLGFNTSNDINRYCFSRPLFSKDRQKVVMMIRIECPGLCGTGWEVVYTKQNNKWTSQTSFPWIN